MFVEVRTTTAAPYGVVVERALTQLRARRWDAAATCAVDENQPVLIRAGLAGVTKRVAVSALDPVSRAGQTVIPFRWVATGVTGEMFPTLEAELRLQRTAEGETEVILVGSYQPPFGKVGAQIDHLLMRRVAQRSLSAFLAQLVEMVSSPDPVEAVEPDTTPLARPRLDFEPGPLA